MRLVIDEHIEKNLRQHAEQDYPFECCGFFYGNDKDDRVILKSLPVNNSKEENKQRRFEVSPLDYMKAEQYALDNHLTLQGVYHSHPDHPAIPSEHDLKQAVPFFSYIIISVKKGASDEIRSWKLKNDKKEFEEEIIELKTK